MKKFRKLVSVILGICLVSSVFALSVPSLTAPVVDNANIVSYQTEQRLNNLLYSLSSQTGMQVAVLTIPSLQGEDLESYSMRVADNWKLGSKEKNTGVLLLVALKERAVRIEVGYGLEDVLTDMKCGLIIRNVIVPYFRDGNYDGGIEKAVENIVGLLTNDETLVTKSVAEGTDASSAGYGGFIFFLLFVIVMILLMSTKTGRKILLLWGIVSSSNNRRGGGGYHGGGFGGSSGGFGGFHGGGGGFGGGGASGHW